MKNEAVCLGGRDGDFLGLIFRHIQYLHAAGCDLYFMVMIKPVPDIQREFSCNGLGDKNIQCLSERRWDLSTQTADIAGPAEKYPFR